MGIARELEEMGYMLGPPNARGVRHGPCPLCGGTDRFAVWPSNDFKCNQCGIKGNHRRFFEIVKGLDQREASARVRESAEGDVVSQQVIDTNYNQIENRKDWVQFAWSVIDCGQLDLAESPDSLAWLREKRGLNEDTVCKMRLGLVDDFAWVRREKCGLRPYQKIDGKWVNRVSLPDGILIPYFARGEGPIAIQVRCWEVTRSRYLFFPGSRLEATLVSFLPPARKNTVVVVESLLDAALIHQETAIPVVALGSTTAPLGKVAREAIEKATLVPLILDSDAAGQLASDTFASKFPNSVQYPVPSHFGQKDITDAWREAGLVVSDFIEDAVASTATELRERSRSGARGRARTARVTPEPPVPPPPPPPAFRYVTDPNVAAEEVRHLADANDTLGVAVEAAKVSKYASHPKAGIDPRLSGIRLIQMAGQSGDPLVIDGLACAAEWGRVLAPLGGRRIVAHDGVRLMMHLLHLGVRVGTVECTMLMWNALTNETVGLADPTKPKTMALTLKSVLRRSIGSRIEGGDIDWNRRTLTEKNIACAADNARHLVPLAAALLVRLRAKGLEPVYDRSRDAQRAVARLEFRGIGFDVSGHAALVAKWRADAAPLERRLHTIMGADINLDSSAQKSDWLLSSLPPARAEAWPRTSDGHLSTAAHALEQNQDLEVALLLLPVSRLRYQLSSCGDSLASFVNPVTGRLHARFHLAGAVTGRMSSSEPNLHSIPRDGGVRELFSVGADRRLVNADFSQIDLRVAALLSGDKRMLDAYRRGEDLHRLTASLVLDVAPEDVTRQDRQLAKALNFGVIYGQGIPALRRSAEANFGVDLTEDQAVSLQECLFRVFQKLGELRDDRGRGARRAEQVKTKGGRTRSFTDGDRRVFAQSLNTPVQGTVGEIMLRALTLVDDRLDSIDAFVVNTVHDDFLVECARGVEDEVETILRACMTQALLETFPDAPTVNLVECNSGGNWGEAK